jgi:amino acid transporter
MNIFNRCSSDDYSFAEWTSMVMLLAGFGLSDTLAVGWFAGIVGAAEVVGGALSFALIAFGAIFTAHEMARLNRA